VTTLTDAKVVSAADVDSLYGYRWQVEVDLRSVKDEMGMDILLAQVPDQPRQSLIPMEQGSISPTSLANFASSLT
jgi:hypothetical protein